MRHRVTGRHFNRDSKHRQAMVMNLLRSLVEHGEITTTKEKGKEVKRWADKLVSTAKKGDLAARRNLHSFFGKRDVVNTLVDRIAPLFGDRTSGFTTDVKLGKRRGDNTEMVKISFVSKPATAGLKAPEAAQAKSQAAEASAKKAVASKTAQAEPVQKASTKKAAPKATVKKSSSKKSTETKAAK